MFPFVFPVSIIYIISLHNEYLGTFPPVMENIATASRKSIHKSKPIFISWLRTDDDLEIIPKFNYKPRGFEGLLRIA
jgi:hypothetical protein